MPTSNGRVANVDCRRFRGLIALDCAFSVSEAFTEERIA